MPTETRRKTVLFVFAHQDDEWFFSTRIERELEWGSDVHCVYLTNGSRPGVAPDVRDRETLRVLERLGLRAENVHLVGSRDGVPPETLPERLEESLDRLRALCDGGPLHRVYCMAWEGGHHDHDAAHLVALAYARERGVGRRVWQMAVYTAAGLPWGLFRVGHPLPLPVRRCRRRLALATAWRHMWLALSYRSQWKGFLGLFPEQFAKRVLLRRETLQAVDPALCAERPHPGALLYESRYGCTWERFRSATAAFVAERVDPSPGGRAVPRRGAEEVARG